MSFRGAVVQACPGGLRGADRRAHASVGVEDGVGLIPRGRRRGCLTHPSGSGSWAAAGDLAGWKAFAWAIGCRVALAEAGAAAGGPASEATAAVLRAATRYAGALPGLDVPDQIFLLEVMLHLTEPVRHAPGSGGCGVRR